LTLAQGGRPGRASRLSPVDEQAKAKAALTELFAEVKGQARYQMVVERIVTDIDEIVRLVRFPWLAKHQNR
jgi:type I restriction enzyme R subunit